MKYTLYRKLEPGSMLEKDDIGWFVDESEWRNPGGDVGCEAGGGWLRPVSIERVTGTESAFPAFDGSGAVGGMTLREHYAGLAMQGFASKHQSWLAFDELAVYSVKAADALIAALNKKEEAA